MSTVTIDRFLGLRLSLTGDTVLKPGEISEGKNFRITQDYKARKREGYKQLFASLGHRIQGQWSGYINGVFFHLFACNGHLYKTINGINTDLGTITDAPTNIFFFNDKVYILTGAEYKSFDGTSLIDVIGHRSKVAISTPPSGGGTPYENINLLNGMKCQGFRSNGTQKDYYIAEQNVNSIDYVKLYGVTKTLTTDYTINLATGKVSFVVQPPNWTGDEDDVEIGWTKGTGNRADVYSHTQSMFFGGKNDTRVFLYGNGTNEMIFSGLADGIPSAEYFTEYNTSKIGSDEFPITYVTKQYDRQLIFTKQGAYYSTYDFDIENGANFPVYPLNDKIGNIPLGQGQLIQNNPFTVTNKVWEWVATSVRDERNAQDKSDRVQPALDNLNLSSAITFDFEDLQEYWLCVNNNAYIYNYGNDTWYYYELYDTPTCFTVIDGRLYMGTVNGQIMKWAKYIDIDTIPEFLTDNGHTIHSRIELGFLDGGVNYKRKFLNFGWVGMKPETKSKCFVEWDSDYDTSTDPEIIYYSLMDFANVDFSDFSFDTNYNPQPFRVKLKAKKFVYFKLILSNDSDTETMTILNITLPMLIGGVAK